MTNQTYRTKVMKSKTLICFWIPVCSWILRCRRTGIMSALFIMALGHPAQGWHDVCHSHLLDVAINDQTRALRLSEEFKNTRCYQGEERESFIFCLFRFVLFDEYMETHMHWLCTAYKQLSSIVLFKAWLKVFSSFHCTEYLYFYFTFALLIFCFYGLHLQC